VRARGQSTWVSHYSGDDYARPDLADSRAGQPRVSRCREGCQRADCRAIANVLLNAGVLLKEAERYAQMSVDSFKQGRYIKEQLAAARARKGEPPKREETGEAVSRIEGRARGNAWPDRDGAG